MNDTPDPVSEPTLAAIQSDPPTVKAAARQRSLVLPLVLGGAVAAALGFGLAQVVPQGWPMADVSRLSDDVAAQSESVAALTVKLADLANAPVPKLDPSLGDRLAAVEGTLKTLPQPKDSSTLMQRLEAVEKKLAGLSGAPGATANPVDSMALSQMQAQIDALKTGETTLDARLAQTGAQLERIKAEAQAVVTQAAGRAALHQLQAAVDSGAPYGAALADLADNDLPDILTTYAQSGLPSLQTLRATFPDAARAALEASLRGTSSDSWTDRVSVFLRGQTGARSLTPREGTDPDAVLSRADAAIAAGDLTLALTELTGLPDGGKAAMADWLALAGQRQDAVAAVQALTASLGK